MPFNDEQLACNLACKLNRNIAWCVAVAEHADPDSHNTHHHSGQPSSALYPLYGVRTRSLSLRVACSLGAAARATNYTLSKMSSREFHARARSSFRHRVLYRRRVVIPGLRWTNRKFSIMVAWRVIHAQKSSSSSIVPFRQTFPTRRASIRNCYVIESHTFRLWRLCVISHDDVNCVSLGTMTRYIKAIQRTVKYQMQVQHSISTSRVECVTMSD